MASVYGINKIQAGEMVEFANGVKGMSMHLPNQAGSTLQNLEKRSYVFGVIN